MFNISFKGSTNEAHGLKIAKRPTVPAPQRRTSLITVPGRDGALLETDGAFEPIQIDIAMNYTGAETSLGDKFRAAKSWLRGSGLLTFSDDPTVFYKVIEMRITAHDRRARTGADLTASAICDPYTYILSGLTATTAKGTVANNYDTSKPIYTITGNGNATLTINGHALAANVGGNLTIDTDLMMAYRADGTLQNSQTSGASYEELWLVPGNNTIALTSGFSLSYIPNWRVL